VNPRPAVAGLVAAASLLLVAGCSADQPSSGSAAAPSTTATPDTPPITLDRMIDVARQAGFEPADIEEFRADYADVRQVVYTLKVTDSLWVEFESRDGGAAEEGWTGPYEVLDATTMRAGEKPCGPITYDYALADDELTLAMTDNQCIGPDGKVSPGELIAQTMIYQSAPFQRVG
jgi:hypothetical protein